MARIWCVLAILVASSYSAVASVKQCYYCAPCAADPYNTTTGTKQTCSMSTLTSSGNTLFKMDNVGVTADTEMVCVKVKSSANKQEAIIRGCALAKVNGKATCDVVKDTAKSSGVTIDFCETCNSDLCNSGNAFVSSLVILVSALFFKNIL